MERRLRGWSRVGGCVCAAILAALVCQTNANAYVVTRALRPPVDAGAFYGWAVAAADNQVMVGAPDDVSSGAAGALYLFDATTSALLSTLHSPTPATDVLFGFPVVALGSNVVVSDFLDGTGATGAGAVHVFATATGTLVGTLQNDPPAASEEFGAALASIGTDILVTVPPAGVAYRLDPLTGTVVATFTAPSGLSFEDGPIAAAGSTVAVGAVDGSGNRSVLLYDGLTGALVDTLTSPALSGDAFGAAVAGFGADVLVGQPDADGTGAVYLFDAATGSVLRTFDNPEPSSTAFGQAVAVVGSRVIVGDPSANDNAGAVYVFDGATGAVLETLTSPDPTQPFFGTALAPFGTSVAVGGNPGVVYLVTACGDGTVDPGEACDDANTASGDGCSATCEVESYFAVRTLVPPVPEAGSFFGAAVAGAGDHVVVGAPLATLGGTAHGAAYLFDATTGALLTTVQSPTPATDALFGFPVVALDAQVIASDFADDTGAADAGAVHVFDADTGTLIRTLQHAVPTAYDTYGYSIAAAGDDVLVVRPAAGEAYRVDPVTGTVGTTFVAPVGLSFVLFPDSPPFPAQAPMVATGDLVALTTSAVGTPSAVQVFDGDTGVLIRTLARPDPSGDVNFGFALAGVGADLLVGAPKGSGKGLVYRFDGTTGALVRTFTAPHPAGAWFGATLAAIGSRVVIGDPSADAGAGAIFVFDGTTGALLQTLSNPNPAQPGFGVVAALGTSLIVGTYTDTGPGAAYVYTTCGDGTVDPGEACDDGGRATGDGCDATCALEPTTTTQVTTTTTTSTTTSTVPLPIAIVQPPGVTVVVGEEVRLEAFASRDPLGATLTFAWSLPLRPAGSSAGLSAIDTAETSFVADAAGTYLVALSVNAGGRESVPTLVTVSALGTTTLGLTIDVPMNGESVVGRVIRVSGSVSGPPNTGVTVNGVSALRIGDSFLVDIPLASGNNLLTATAHTPDASSLSRSVRVVASDLSQVLTLKAIQDSGVAPLRVDFDFDYRGDNPIASVEIDFDGDGTVDLTSNSPRVTLSHLYESEGTFSPELRVVDSTGGVHRASTVVYVNSLMAMDALFRGIWTDLTSALAGGDLDGALLLMTSDARRRYASPLESLLPDMPGIVASFSAISAVQIAGPIAEYVVTRPGPQGAKLFYIYFLREGDGVWRLESM